MTFHKPITIALARAWRSIAGPDPSRLEPGFFGRIPYLLFLRFIILLGILVWFSLYQSVYGTSYTVRAVIVLMATVAVLATYIVSRPSLRRSRHINLLLISGDHYCPANE